MARVFCLVGRALLVLSGLCGTAAGWSAEPEPPAVAAEPDWTRAGHTRLDWQWIVKRYDANADGRVARSEVPLAAERYQRVDRNWDGLWTAADFDWSQDGPLVRQKETAFALFKAADQDSNGRLNSEEWQQLFARAAPDGQLDEEALERLIYLPRVLKTANETRLRLGDSEFSPGRQAQFNQGAPMPGDVAPDFELKSPDGTSGFRLSDQRGQKPVVLVFGCYTCGNYRTYSAAIEALHQRWQADAAVVRVYVREAHPVSEQQAATATNSGAGILIKQPESFAERCAVAERFTSALQITTPVFVDGIDNRVGEVYRAWPDRLYLVDREGRIAFTGTPGPFGFNPRELEQTLALLTLEQASSRAAP